MPGGSANTAGTTFQENVAAWFSCLILADIRALPVAELSSVTLDGLTAETVQPIDDLQVLTSNGGRLFIQAKTTVNFSENDSRFASAIRQFVGQYTKGFEFPSGSFRPLDESLDRFILAVGPSAPSTIRNSFRDLLATIRPCRDTASFELVRHAFSDAQEEQFGTLCRVIESQCIELCVPSLSLDSTLQLLRFLYVLSFDFTSDGHSLREAHNHLRQTVLLDPSRSNDAWNLLIGTVREFSPKRTGGNRQYFRQQLEKHDLTPRSVSSAEPDIRALQSASSVFERHIQNFSHIEFNHSEVHISRPVVPYLLQEAKSGDILVTGTAGAGKSGCLYDFVQQSREEGADVLLLAVDQLAASSLGEINRELGLSSNRDIVEVLADWSGESNAFLVIDALDAARTQYGLASLRTLIQQIRRHAPRWKVVAAIREFDLRHSRDIRQLFSGSQHHEFGNHHFEDVRHIWIDQLSEGELAELAVHSPTIAEGRNASTVELQALTRNPFNLRLFAELLDSSGESEQLTSVRTQVGLLDLYWTERVDSLPDNWEITEGIEYCVRRMVDLRRLTASTSEVRHPSISSTTWITPLASSSVLKVSDHSLAGGEPQISFLHNILFDYAVARLILVDLSPPVIDRLSDEENHDLFLAIRPSIVLSFQRMWHSEESHRTFWERAISLVDSDRIRLFGKIIAADVAAIEFMRTTDVAPLLQRIDAASSQTLLRYCLQAAIAHHQQDPVRNPLWGPDAPEWLLLISDLAHTHIDTVPQSIRAFLSLLPQ